MRSKSMRIFLILFGLSSLTVGLLIAQAAPAPPKLVVNHETKECATIFGGDECLDCSPPPGWETLGWEGEADCPEGYSFTQIEEICTPFKIQRCCTEGHSGAAGDCEDLVINRLARKCAFVEDVNACNLPARWQAKPADTSLYDWTCPEKFNWEDALECQAEPVPGQEEADSASGWLPFRCGSAALGIFLIPGMVLGAAKIQKQGHGKNLSKIRSGAGWVEPAPPAQSDNPASNRTA